MSDVETFGLSEILTPKQLAEFLEVSPESLANNRLFNVGIPYVKYGRLIRYLRKDVVGYLEANRKQVSA